MNTIANPSQSAIRQRHESNPLVAWLRRQAVAFLIAFIILASASWLRWQSSLMPENIQLPRLQVPSPNAYDFYSRAGAKLRDSDAIWWAVEHPVGGPPATADEGAPTIAGRKRGTGPITASEKEYLLKENAAALTILRQGLIYDYLSPQPESFDTVDNYLNLSSRSHLDDRTLGHLLAVEGDRFAAQGEWQRAESSYLDAMKLGSDVPHGSSMDGADYGLGIQWMARRQMQSGINHLTGNQAEADAERLQRIDASQVTYADILNYEKWTTQGELLTDFASPSWRQHIMYMTGSNNIIDSRPEAKYALKFESPRTAYDRYSDYMNALIAQSHGSWPNLRQSKPPLLPTDPVNLMLFQTNNRMELFEYGDQALNRLLETQLALRAYFADHGSYTNSLEDLLPRYLTTVPTDPFSNHQPLRYKPNKSTYLLYSIGPDAKDDGGKPLTYNQKYERHRFRTDDPNASGDIVAAVND